VIESAAGGNNVDRTRSVRDATPPTAVVSSKLGWLAAFQSEAMVVSAAASARP
jgi:hypothetical protein